MLAFGQVMEIIIQFFEVDCCFGLKMTDEKDIKGNKSQRYFRGFTALRRVSNRAEQIKSAICSDSFSLDARA